MPEPPASGAPPLAWVVAALLQVLPAVFLPAGPLARLMAALLGLLALALVAAGARGLGRCVGDVRTGEVAALLAWFGSPLWLLAGSGAGALAGAVRVWQAPAGPPAREALLGLLSHPSRGLLWFAPLLAVAPLAPRAWSRRRADIVVAVTVVAIFLLAAASPDWRGGGYGIRLLLPALPLLALPAARLLGRVGSRGRAVLAGLALTGFVVGATAARDPRFAADGPPGALLLLAHPAVAAVALLAGALFAWRLLALLPPVASPPSRPDHGENLAPLSA